MSNTLKLLLLAANSVDTIDPRTSEEIQAIDQAVQAAPLRDTFHVRKEPALRTVDIGPFVLKHTPDVLHISGHSTQKSGLILQNELGQVARISCDRLSEVVLGAGSGLRLVCFGFCHSAECVRETAKRIDFVLGIDGEISVRSSLAFFPAFYEALASGRSVQEAVEYGKGILRYRRYKGAKAIMLQVREGADVTKSLIALPKHGDKLKSALERLVHGVKSERDWSTLRKAIDSGVLVLSPRDPEDKDLQEEAAAISFTESSGIYHAALAGDVYNQVSGVLHPTPPGIAPPFRPSIFVGREGALRDIKGLLTVKRGRIRENVTVIYGWPGVGKTSLVSAIGHDREIAESFKDGILWVSLEQKSNLIPEIAKWGRALGSQEILKALTVRDATAQLATLLRKRNMLLIIDDVWDTGHAAAFSDAAGEQCSVMITTRLPLVVDALTIDQTHTYNLPVLTEEFALMVLRILVPKVVAENERDCLELVLDLECLPLALHVAAGMLRSEARLGWGVSELIERIRKGTEIINTTAPRDRIERNGVIPSVSSLLHRSTDVLDKATREYFAYLGVFAPKPATFDLSALRIVWRVNDPKPIVRQLVGHGLLEHVGGGRFQMHRILVDHAVNLYSKKKSKK